MAIALESIQEMVRRTNNLRHDLKEEFFSPNGIKPEVLKQRFTPTEAALLVGRSTSAIRKAEGLGQLPKPDLDAKNTRRLGYTLEQLEVMRKYFKTQPHRHEGDETLVIPFLNFKGGTGKSTNSVNGAQYLAKKGYRVLLIDADPQASATAQFGYNPDADIDSNHTLYDYLSGDAETLETSIRSTYWTNLDLIPSNLTLYGAEYTLAAAARENNDFFLMLRDGIDTIKDKYDVIIIDPPPALGMITLNVIHAANAMVIPMRPAMLDFFSSCQLFTLLEEVTQALAQNNDTELEYHFIKALVTMKKEKKKQVVPDDKRRKDSEEDVTDFITDHYGDYCMKSIIYNSKAITTAQNKGMTLYEIKSNERTIKRAIDMFDEFGDELEALILNAWPSRQKSAQNELRRAGLG